MKHTFLHARALMAGAAFFFAAVAAHAQDADARIQKLENEVAELRRLVAALQEQGRHETALPQAAPAASATSAAAPDVSFYDAVKRSAAELMKPVAEDHLELDISVILDMNVYHDTSSDGVGHVKQNLRGFGHHHHDGHDGHGHDDFENGFNLRHVELGLSAAVDPYFRAWATVAVDEEGAELEEAVIQTTGLPYGLTLSGGKIKSGIGRLNRQHSHNWEFVDQPLVHELFFGHHGLVEKGVQLTWLAPTPFYLLVGTEVFNGDNEQSFAVGESDALPSHSAPRLWTGFVKAAPDLGDNHALQVGLSALSGRHQTVHEDDEAASGNSTLFGADFVYKYDAKRGHGHGDVTLQGEYFYRDMDLDGKGEWGGDIWRAKQDGYYVQALYGLLPRWRTGVRWDHIGLTNDVRTPEDGVLSCGKSYRLSGMLDWTLSEFSLLRAQVGRGWYDTEDGRKNAWEFAIQWQVTFGKHAAHDF